MFTYTRLALVTALAAFVGLAVALVAIASSGSSDEVSATPQDAVDTSQLSCAGLQELESYRYTVAVQMDLPTPTPEPETTAPAGTPAPLTAFAEALAQLFSDFSLEGAHVAPDRTQAVLSFQDDELELRIIGDEAWVRTGDTWQPDETSAEDVITPLVLCNEVIAEIRASLRPVRSEVVEVNGIQARHYDLDPETTQDLPSLLGQDISGGYAINLWLAEGGGWPAQFIVESSNTDAGTQFRMVMSVFDVGNPDIVIEAP
jgi:hypothetical protein